MILANGSLLRCPGLEAPLLCLFVLTLLVENPCKPPLRYQSHMILRAKLICICIKRFPQKSLYLRILAEHLQEGAESSLGILNSEVVCLERFP